MIATHPPPRFSVVVCTRNRGDSLRRTCASVLQLREPPGGWELLIIDNGSTEPKTHETIDSVVACAPNRVRAVFEQRLGLSHARNRAALAASGEILAFLDDDATPDPNWLLALADAFDDSNADIVGGRVYLRLSQPPPAWMREFHHVYLSAFDLGDRPLWLRYDSYPRGTNLALRRGVLSRCGGFSGALGRKGTTLLSGEEIELCVRAERAGARILYSPDAVVHHHVHSERLKTVWLGRRLASQGRSEALIEWMHGGLAGCTSGARRLLSTCVYAASSSTAHPPVHRSAVRRQLLGYLFGAIEGMVRVPRIREARGRPLPAWRPRRLPPEPAPWIERPRRTTTSRPRTGGVRVLSSIDPCRSSPPPAVSIVVPTCNGGDRLRRCLSGIQVQCGAPLHEVICVDSSTDEGEVAKLAGEYGLRVISIDPSTFDHGLARDLGAEQARGEILVFVNQDVVPCDSSWLAKLIAPLARPEVAAVQGGIREFPERSRRFYWDSCGERFYFTRESREWLAAHGGVGLSTVNLALRRQAWIEVPFGPAPIMEDKKWQAAAAQRGFGVACRPDAAVFHSHAYDLRSVARRCVSEGLGWSYLGESYPIADALRDMVRAPVYADLLRGLASREITGAGELLFPWLRPLLLYYGNRWRNHLLP